MVKANLKKSGARSLSQADLKKFGSNLAQF